MDGRTDYFEFVLEYLEAEDGDRSYSNLLWQLYNIEFVALIDMDRNRIANALYLRDRICEDEGIRYVGDGFCSALDILIHLADRMAFNLDRLDEEESGLKCYFWELIENFGFTDFDDSVWNCEVKDEVFEVVNQWIERKYDASGKNTPFPKRHRAKNFRHLELWDQMQMYMEENY